MGDADVLVTGATGFIGLILVPRLLEDGRRVRVLQRRPGPVPAGVEAVAGDVTNRESLTPAMDGVSTVINLAGVVSHLESDRPRMEAVSVTGAENVLAAARAAGVKRVVHVSSVASVGMAEVAGSAARRGLAVPRAGAPVPVRRHQACRRGGRDARRPRRARTSSSRVRRS